MVKLGLALCVCIALLGACSLPLLGGPETNDAVERHKTAETEAWADGIITPAERAELDALARTVAEAAGKDAMGLLETVIWTLGGASVLGGGAYALKRRPRA